MNILPEIPQGQTREEMNIRQKNHQGFLRDVECRQPHKTYL